MDEGADGISEFDLYWLNMGNSVAKRTHKAGCNAMTLEAPFGHIVFFIIVLATFLPRI